MPRDSTSGWVASPNFWTGRRGYKPRYIIIHGTAGGGAVEWLCNSTSGASVHYVIERNGTIVCLVDENDSAWGNGIFDSGHDAFWNESINPNLITISIEHEKLDTNNASSLTDAQIASSYKLIESICQRWNIPKKPADEHGGITGHYSIEPINRKNCPGPYPWNDLYAYLQKNNNNGEEIMLQLGTGIGSFFTDNNGRWHCQNTGHEVIGGILNYYRTIGGAIRLPLTGEVYPQPGVAYQVFEAGIVVWDPGDKMQGPGTGPAYLLMLQSELAKKILGAQSNSNPQIDKQNLKNKLNALVDAL